MGNLLNISRIESHRVKDKPEKVDLVRVIREVVVECNDKIEEQEVKIKLNSPSHFTITYDKELIREVVSNLIANAIKFNKQNGVVVIHLEKHNTKWLLQVANTGLVIPKKDQAHIFERFYRASDVKDKFSGTGLGLHIVQEYAKKWHGNVSFKSPAHFSERSMKGDKLRGTIFTLQLPVSAKQTK